MRFVYLIILFMFVAQVSAQGVVWGGKPPVTKSSEYSTGQATTSVSNKLRDILQDQQKQFNTVISKTLTAASTQLSINETTKNLGEPSELFIPINNVSMLNKLVFKGNDEYGPFQYVAGTCQYFDDRPCVFDFLMSAYEVTNQEYASYNAEFYSDVTNKQYTDFSQLPVSNVSARMAIDYAAWLSAETGRTFRLPTLQEWKQAAELVNRSSPSCLYANFANHSNDALYAAVTVECGAGYRASAPVGSLEPSYNGIYDLYGNVAEWVCAQSTLAVSCNDPNNYLAVGNGWNSSADKSITFLGQSAPFVGFRLVEDI